MALNYISTLKSHPTIVVVGVGSLFVAVLWAALVILHPMPPHTVTMATGPEGGAYYEIGKRYRKLLAQEGIELRLVPTAGALENLSRLRGPRSNVDAGFLQSGITTEKESPGLESLGTVFYEPLWFFYRGAYQGKGLEGLQGKKISIGPEGSATRALVLELFARSGYDKRFAQMLSLTPREAADKLLSNEIDAALMVSSWDSPVVRQLLADTKIELVSFPFTDAYVALYPYLNKLVVPAGVGDMVNNRPQTDALLLAPKTSLVVRQDLHTAIQFLLLDAAEKVHSGPGIFNKAGQFPAAEAIDLPLSDEARQFYKSGPPFLQRHLPFWLAVMIDRLLVLLIPLVGILYPLLRVLEAIYDRAMQQRIFRLYGELRFLELEIESLDAGAGMDELAVRLDRLEGKANLLHVPVTYANMLYTLRDHIVLVRGRLKNSGA